MPRTTYLRREGEERFGFLNNLLSTLRQRRKLIYLATAIGAAIALPTVLLLPNEYTSRAKVIPVIAGRAGSDQPSVTNFLQASPAGTFANPRVIAEGFLYMELLTSNSVLDSVLAGQYATAKSAKSGNLFALFKTNDLFQARRKLRSMAKFRHTIKTGVVTIEVESTDPQLSSQVANAFVNQLDLYKQRLDRAMAGKVGRYLQGMLSEEQAKLKQAEEEQAEFLAKNRNYLNADDPELKLQMERLALKVFFHRELVLTLMRYKASSDMETEKSIPRLTVIERAEPPLRKSGPQRAMLVFLITFGAALFSIGVITARVTYEWYFPHRTRQEVADSYSTIGDDFRLVIRRLRSPLRLTPTEKS